MRLIDMNEFKNLPVGSVYSLVDNDGCVFDISIVSSRCDDFTCGEIPLFPLNFVKDKEIAIKEMNENGWNLEVNDFINRYEDEKTDIKDKKGEYFTSCTSVDTCSYDYNKDQMFIVYDRQEVERWVEILINSLSGFDLTKLKYDEDICPYLPDKMYDEEDKGEE